MLSSRHFSDDPAAVASSGGSPWSITWLRWAVISLLIGRIWQYFFWLTPYHDWGEGWSWQVGAGLFLLVAAVLVGSRQRRGLLVVLAISSLILLGQALSGWVAHRYEFPHLIEHSLAWSSPLLLGLALWRPGHRPSWARIAVGLTFTGHGLYALGWPYPTPPHFQYMTQTLLGAEAGEAQLFLRIAGGLDLLIAVGIFLPQVAQPLLLYACCWGLATAWARPLAYVALDSWGEDLHRWGMEMVFRLPHSLVPLALWWEARSQQRGKRQKRP